VQCHREPSPAFFTEYDQADTYPTARNQWFGNVKSSLLPFPYGSLTSLIYHATVHLIFNRTPRYDSGCIAATGARARAKARMYPLSSLPTTWDYFWLDWEWSYHNRILNFNNPNPSVIPKRLNLHLLPIKRSTFLIGLWRPFCGGRRCLQLLRWTVKGVYFVSLNLFVLVVPLPVPIFLNVLLQTNIMICYSGSFLA
jgi:hypothetical protein